VRIFDRILWLIKEPDYGLSKTAEVLEELTQATMDDR
jgi:hypothetical protein